MNIFKIADNESGLTQQEIAHALRQSLEDRHPRRVLILPPDFTRYHSNAGFITNTYYHILQNMGAEVDIMPALGTHEPMTGPYHVRRRTLRKADSPQLAH